MDDPDQSPLVSSTSPLPPPQPPQFQYQFVKDPEEEEEEEEEDEEEEDELDDERLEVREVKKPLAAPAPTLPLSPPPAPSSAPPPLVDLGGFGEPGPAPQIPSPPTSKQAWGASSRPEVSPPSFPPSSFSSSSSPSAPEEEEQPPPPPPPRGEPRPPAIPPRNAPQPPPKKEEQEEQEKGARHPKAASPVVDLLYWRDVKKTGVVFGASLFLLLSLTVFSIVSVVAYIALALLSVTISLRIYKGVIQAIQKSDEGHPFRAYLDKDVAVSEEIVQKYSNVVLGHFNSGVKELRRLFLVDDLVDSLKFAVLMWVFTYVGALFNGLTLLILALISLFSIPIIYEKHQAQIDHYVGLVNKNVKDGMAKIQAKIPGIKRKAE
ncbi:reticulon-4 isoform X5 [Anolis carolinensis]|uniref:reticulon-4 isoform X5 n=1 Tax=Anolis carolinensis TaxID=28377 RepID=UPI002F2B390F